MKRFAANVVFPVTSKPIRNGIIEVDDNGKITDIIYPKAGFKEIHSTQFFNGVIVPGFINAHCHLELSHLKGLKAQKTGIAGFIEAVTNQRKSTKDFIHKSIEKSIAEAYRSGTVAIGDICNTTDTLTHKLKSDIYFYNFIELFGIDPSTAQNTFNNGINIYNEYCHHFPNQCSLSPHSTYSLSKPLWKLVSNFINQDSTKRVSIHYAESRAEYDFLKNGNGPLYQRYTGSNISFEPPSNLTPSKVIIENIPPLYNLLLIHNTFAQYDEIMRLSEFYKDLTLVTCPESNLIIENSLPNLTRFKDAGVNIAIGTDSLASASSLSILSQIKIILDHFKTISFETALSWATINGAKALGFESKLGSLEIGKRPGLLLISPFDFQKMKPAKESIVKRLI